MDIATMTTCAWLWIYFGMFMMLMELLAPGFVCCFFGLSAVTVGGCRFLFGEAFSLNWQVAAFSVFSILYIVTLRRALKNTFTGRTTRGDVDFDNEYVGRAGKITVAVNPPLTGRVMIGDAEWTAEADEPLAAGAEVKVVGQNNLTMKVKGVN